MIIGLLRSKREQSRIEALHFIKPRQDLSVSGGLVHTHTRDPFLASLPKQALDELAKSYDAVIAKYPMHLLYVEQDGPQNQIESKPAIEAVVVNGTHSA